VDAALAMGFCIAAAEAAGLGTCPVSYVRNHMEKVAPLLGLPKGVFPVAGLTLGFPAAREPVTARLPPAVVVHRHRYSADGEAEAIAAYDARRSLAKPRYPEIHGPAPEGCRWSENAARQLAVPERAGFRAWLRSRGFALD
jgi:nitroreductase/FMN reductase [NAD(P)H]